MNQWIDLRSDTVTKPTQAMRLAMMNAEVGDDVYEDDPTVIQLQKEAAKLVNMEDALFVASGTMGNQCAIMTHTHRGDEIIAHVDHHTVVHEVGAMAVLSAVNVRTIVGDWTIEKIVNSIRTPNIHYPTTSLVCIENALSNGTVMSAKTMQDSIKIAKQHGLAIHVDGARIFNAAVALNTSASSLLDGADSVMFCLSKGLCAPVGSILAGSSQFIKKARKNRKILGGGWRQAGVLAACGLISIREMIHRLDEDHQNAKELGYQLNNIQYFNVMTKQLDINMVFFSINPEIDSHDFSQYLLSRNIRINDASNGQYRFVIHNDVSTDNIHHVVSVCKEYGKYKSK